MPILSIATDEDILNRAIGDWPLIAPKFQLLASASDGVIVSGSPWNLVSASSNFATQGLAYGHVVIFYKDATFSTVIEMLVVDSVSGSTAILRRPGRIQGQGMPPTIGTSKSFKVLSSDSQISRATYEIQRQYRIQTADDIQDFEDLRRAVVLSVLENLYFDSARNIGEQSDDFGSKYKATKSELKLANDWLSQTYLETGASEQAISGLMNLSIDVPVVPYFNW